MRWFGKTIDADQIDDLMNRRDVRQPKDWDDRDSGGNGSDGGAAKADDTEERPERPINVDKPGDATS
jgi:cell division protease FtsH